MIPEWYVNWSIRHMETFGLQSHEKSASLFGIWGSVWSAMFSEPELNLATQEMISDRRTDHEGRSLLRWPDEHRTAVPAAVMAIRKRMSRRNVPTAPVVSSCQYCSGCGWAMMPHPGRDDYGRLKPVLTMNPHQLNRFGEPIFYTLAVLCECEVGSAKERLFADLVADGKRKEKPLTLRRYIDFYPDWPDVMMHAESFKQHRRAAAGGAPENVQRITEALAISFSLPRPQRQSNPKDLQTAARAA